jgi:anti-sigma factor RsiW
LRWGTSRTEVVSELCLGIKIMDSFLRDILEDYLSGTLSRARKAQLESHLARHPAATEELEAFRRTSALLTELRAPEDLPGPEPGFYARILQRIDQHQEEPFWAFFLQPLFVRRLAFGSLMWLALVGAYVVSFSNTSPDTSQQLAADVLTDQPITDYYRVRLGNNLERNRDSMLAVVMTSGD